MSEHTIPLVHWADNTAERLIRQKGDRDSYVLASGITPSGVVHFGNFREVITTEFVARALKARGKKVRFIFSWDDYDTFRKIPANMPKQEELKEYLFRPIVDTPDPYEKEASYAAHHEKSFESQLGRVGISAEFIYQAPQYRKGIYKDLIKKAIDCRQEIKDILNQHRKTPYGDDYLPVSVYCEKCETDQDIKNKTYNDGHLHYQCGFCGHEGKEELENTTRLKLPWRIDWPMRWSFEKVDFEPGGKDHSSQGGSHTTAKEIVKVFGGEAPVYLQYDFVSIKGAGGKMSSSSGNVITVNDVLKVYEPEMVRWIFASYRPNVDFSVSFDLDAIKTYEDFDRQERLAFGLETGNEKKVNMAKRVYELSQLEKMPEVMPFQPSFRHLTNILQIHDGEIAKARDYYSDEIKNERDERRFQERANCALYWLEHYAPEDFKFNINKSVPAIAVGDEQRLYIGTLSGVLEKEWDSFNTDKALHERLYELIHQLELSPADVFPTLYQILINKEKGPKLASFIRTIGQQKVLNLLTQINQQ